MESLPFTPTLTNFATERTKESGPTEKILEKYRFCPEKADLVVQPWCKKEKEKCKCLKIKHLHFCWVPGAEVFMLLSIDSPIELTA